MFGRLASSGPHAETHTDHHQADDAAAYGGVVVVLTEEVKWQKHHAKARGNRANNSHDQK